MPGRLLDKLTPAERKEFPLFDGCIAYFIDALLAVSNISWHATDQHHPGETMHWDRNKSKDELNTCARHLSQHGAFDSDGKRHTAKAAWRALALLQKELEEDLDLDLSPASTKDEPKTTSRLCST